MLTIRAPAKLNLTLEVLGKRPDGFHEIRSVIQTIDLCDELRFELSPHVAYRSDSAGWSGEKSLVARTVELVRQTTGTDKGVTITVRKRIPLVSGLGGDSSDAAATLQGLSKLWGLDLSVKRLHGLATQLGSDMPFFLYNGTALIEGRGEKVTPLPPIRRTWLVLMVPDVPRPPRKTERLYASLQKNHYTDGGITDRLVEAIKAGEELASTLIINTFENVAFDLSNELAVYRRHILKIGADNLHLAGSGPAMFTVVKDRAEGEELCQRMQSQRLEIYLTHTISSADH